MHGQRSRFMCHVLRTAKMRTFVCSTKLYCTIILAIVIHINYLCFDIGVSSIIWNFMRRFQCAAKTKIASTRYLLHCPCEWTCKLDKWPQRNSERSIPFSDCCEIIVGLVFFACWINCIFLHADCIEIVINLNFVNKNAVIANHNWRKPHRSVRKSNFQTDHLQNARKIQFDISFSNNWTDQSEKVDFFSR